MRRGLRPTRLIALVVVIVVVVVVFVIVKSHNENRASGPSSSLSSSWPSASLPSLEPINCHINERVSQSLGLIDEGVARTVACYVSLVDNEVYLPFNTFLSSYLTVKGELDSSGFHWSHSFGKIYPEFGNMNMKESDHGVNRKQDEEMLPPLLQFHTFDVEARPRVLCTSAQDSVPVSTQWDKLGYYYVTQIAQFGLAHHAKLVLGNKSRRRVVIIEDKQCNENHRENQVAIEMASISAAHKDKDLLVVYLDNADPSRANSIVVQLRTTSNEEYNLVYTSSFSSSTFMRRTKKNEALFGFDKTDSKRFIRDVSLDFAKAFESKSKKKHKNITKILIEQLKLEGKGCLFNVSLANEEHELNFKAAADYFVNYQDSEGGWSVDVVFNKDYWKYSVASEIKEGWYTAMGQGQAISLLSRAFLFFSDIRYLETAIKATSIFDVDSNKGGVRATFMDRWVWYEEYPTQPNSFVLNGFMYSLIGLSDLKTALKATSNDNYPKGDGITTNVTSSLYYVGRLWDDGVASLIHMLPLFDAGTTSFYDLRHVTMRTAPKIARWDYHATHVNLLLWISKLLEDEEEAKFLLETAQRWTKYMAAIPAGHN